MITLEEAQQIVEGMMKMMRGFIECGQVVAPVGVALGEKETKLISFDMAFLKDVASKEALAHAMRQVMREANTPYAAFLSDSWHAEVDMKGAGEIDLSGGVKNVPGRREAISVVFFDQKENRVRHALWAYDRDEQGRPVFEDRIVWTETGVQTRFAPRSMQKPKEVGNA